MDEYRSNLRAVEKQRNDKYFELVREKRDNERAELNKKREAEKQAKIQKWYDFLEFRENTIQEFIDTLHKMEAGESVEDKSAAGAKKVSQRDRSSPMSGFNFMIKSIQDLITQLKSIHLNHEIKLKGKGCKEADEAFAKMIKKNDEENKDVDMIPTKREQLQNERVGDTKKINKRIVKTKVFNMDDFLDGEDENAESKDTEGEKNIDKPRLSENQTYTLSKYEIQTPNSYEEIIVTVGKLEDIAKDRIKKELENWEKEFERIKALREEFTNPPAEKLEEEPKKDETKEGNVEEKPVEGEKKEEKTEAPKVGKETPNRRRGITWFYVPQELIKEAYRFRIDGWPEKLGLPQRPKNQNNERRGNRNNNNNNKKNGDRKEKQSTTPEDN